jgi:hypothetical protein
MADVKYPSLLRTTPYVGSATNRVVHKTDAGCQEAIDISPDERWYIKDIPHDGNYLLCAFCFPEAKDKDEDSPNLAAEDSQADAGAKPLAGDTKPPAKKGRFRHHSDAADFKEHTAQDDKKDEGIDANPFTNEGRLGGSAGKKSGRTSKTSGSRSEARAASSGKERSGAKIFANAPSKGKKASGAGKKPAASRPAAKEAQASTGVPGKKSAAPKSSASGKKSAPPKSSAKEAQSSAGVKKTRARNAKTAASGKKRSAGTTLHKKEKKLSAKQGQDAKSAVSSSRMLSGKKIVSGKKSNLKRG